MPPASISWSDPPSAVVPELHPGTTSSPGLRAGQPSRMVVGFAQALRAHGVPVTADRVVTFTHALGALGLADRRRVYDAGLATLVQRPEDRARYDRAFAAWWLGQPVTTVPVFAEPVTAALDDGSDDAGSDPGEDGDQEAVAVRYSRIEVLRRRDFATYTPAEWAEAAALLAAFRIVGEQRPHRRLQPTKKSRGQPDLRRTLRRSTRTSGEPLQRSWRASTTRPRRLVLLVDVSGSMEPYARALVRFAHAAVSSGSGGGDTEAFAFGTRLTRLTRELRRRDPEAALAAASTAVADWSGGTRLGEALGTFTDRYGVRGTARGAVVVILSDGWDRGDPHVLADEMARLRRLAHRIVWVNPLKASPGYAPLARGMAAALPYVDDFVEGHSLAALSELATVIVSPANHRRAQLSPMP